jgi:uncharacterized protein
MTSTSLQRRRARELRSTAGLVVSLLAAGVAAIALPGCSAREREPIDFGTTTQGSISYATAVALAQISYQKAGIRGRIQPNSGGGALLFQVHNGELDFGISAVGEVEEAYLGRRVFAGRELDNLRVVAVLYPIRSALFVRDGSSIEEISDLEGRNVTSGFKAMPALDGIFAAVLANGGISQEEIEPVMVPNVTRGADDFASGRADAFFFGVGAAKVIEVDASVGGVRLLPLDTSPEALRRMRQHFRYGYPILEQPAGNTVGVSAPVYVMAYDNLLVTHAGTPPARVREVLNLLADHREELARMMPQFRRFSEDQMYKEMPLPYHPAAVQWFGERGIGRVPLQERNLLSPGSAR